MTYEPCLFTRVGDRRGSPDILDEEQERDVPKEKGERGMGRLPPLRRDT